MLTPDQAAQARDAWYNLATRHMMVADASATVVGWHDITIFHTYHAYECLLCAFIASERWEVPKEGGIVIGGKHVYQGPLPTYVATGEHDARAKFAAHLFAASIKPYHDVYVRLDSRQKLYRNGSLYIEDSVPPDRRFTAQQAEWCVKNVRKFMDELWKDIQNKPLRLTSPT